MDVVQTLEYLQQHFVPVLPAETGVAVLGSDQQSVEGCWHLLHQHKVAALVHDDVDDFDDEARGEGAQSLHAHYFAQCWVGDAVFGFVAGEETFHCLEHFGSVAIADYFLDFSLASFADEI